MSQILALSRLSKIKLCSLYLSEFQQLLDINLAIDILNKKVNLLGRLLFVAADIENSKSKGPLSQINTSKEVICVLSLFYV